MFHVKHWFFSLFSRKMWIFFGYFCIKVINFVILLNFGRKSGKKFVHFANWFFKCWVFSHGNGLHTSVFVGFIHILSPLIIVHFAQISGILWIKVCAKCQLTKRAKCGIMRGYVTFAAANVTVRNFYKKFLSLVLKISLKCTKGGA